MLWLAMFVECVVGISKIYRFCIHYITKESIRGEEIISFKVLAIILFITLVIFFLLMCLVKEETKETAKYELVSLQDNSQLSEKALGILFYVYASMGTKEVYTYYYKYEEGFKRGKICSENVVIYEQDNIIPIIKEYTKFDTTKHWLLSCIIKILMPGVLGVQEKKYEIFVPKGTIAKDFKLDAQ